MTTTTLIEFDAFVLSTVETALTERGLRLRHCTTGEIEQPRQLGNGLLAELLRDLSVLYEVERVDPSA